MTHINRRNFLRLAASAAALGPFPPAIQKALAIPANNATGTINDVEHVIILMQENRSFDHYYGTLPGVRGFSNHFTIPMASGRISLASARHQWHCATRSSDATRNCLARRWRTRLERPARSLGWRAHGLLAQSQIHQCVHGLSERI